MTVNVVILAAGQGKRMQSALPKVLHPLAGVPLLAHVLAAARALQPSRNRHPKPEILKFFSVTLRPRNIFSEVLNPAKAPKFPVLVSSTSIWTSR